MNANAMTRHYDRLTPAERFPLILQANARGDEAEADRLASAAGWLAFRQRDFTPYAEAFRDLAEAVYMELFDLTLWFVEIDRFYDDAARGDAEADEDDPDTDAETEQECDVEAGGDDGGPPECDYDGGHAECDRTFDLLLAAGFILKTKLAGWKLFCDRRHIPAFALWEYMPGYKRLKEYFDRVERTSGPAHVREGMLRWSNGIARKKGQPERTDAELISPAGAAAGLDTLFDWHLKRHAG
jgi:hypothetical protein